MSFYGAELNTQLNRLMLSIRIFLEMDRYMPNIRTIFNKFSQFDPQITGLITGLSFEQCLNVNGIFIKKHDIQLLEKAFNQQGKINWLKFLNHLREPMSPCRKVLIEKIFDSLDTQRLGKISSQDLMSHFNYNVIDTYKNGIKSKHQINKEFLSMLHIQEGFVTQEEFIQFHDDLNINFGPDDIFVRYCNALWLYTPDKLKEVHEKEIKMFMLLLRNKLLEKTQASKDQFLISKLFKEYDINKKSCLGTYDLSLMFKKLGISIDSRLILPILQKIDQNKSGYIELDEFKRFLYKNPYPY